MKHLYLVIALFLCLSIMKGIAGGEPQKFGKYIPVAEGFTYLNASADGDEIRIEWGLVNDEDPDYFMVERQVGILGFETIGGLNYHSERPSRMFAFYDMAARKNTTLTYRIKMVREDGSVVYSETFTLFVPENRDYYTYPAVVSDIINLEYALPFLTRYEIRLYNFNGTLMFHQNGRPANDLQIRDQIHVNHLPAGLYFLQVIVDGETHTRRVIKN
ncbi:MAG: T9SS type A sorting domain-containing protein [Bacteroidia bacterium]